MLSVDLSKAIPASLLAYPQVIADTIPMIAEAVRAEIVRMANERLSTTTEDYVAGLQPVIYPNTGRLPAGEPVVAVIELLGTLPNMVENGWPGGDLKPILLGSRSAKMTKTGPMVVIPFRHGTPGTSGRNMPEMGSQYGWGFRLTPNGGVEVTGAMDRGEAARLGRRVHQAAKELSPTTSHASRGTDWGERLGAGFAPKLRPHHRTDIYAGMVRQEKVYRRARQSSYFTFRAISSKSDPGSWLHPGIEGHELFTDAAEYAGRIAGHLLQQAARRLP